MDDDVNIERERKIQTIKESVYRFFYNIWPSVQKTINFFVYYIVKTLKASVRIAMEQFRSK